MVNIGMRELYDLLLDVRDRVAELANDRKRDTAEIKETKLKVDKLDERLSRLERLKWIVTGAAVAGGAVASRIVDALSLG